MPDKKAKSIPWITIIAVLFALYCLVGFIVLPMVIKHVLTHQVAETVKHDITVTKARVNPFTWTIQLSDFAIQQSDQKPLISFKHLLLNFQLTSIFKDAWTVKELTVNTPYVFAELNPDGTVNLQKLIPADKETAPAPTADKSNEKPGKAVVIQSLIVDKAEIAFRDNTPSPPFEYSLKPINLGMENVSTRLDDKSLLNLFIKTAQGESIDVNSRFTINPLKLSSKIHIANLKLSTINTYLAAAAPLSLEQGVLNVDGTLTYQSSGDATPSATFVGSTSVRDFDMLTLDEQKPYVAFQSLAVKDMNLKLLAKDFQIGSVTLDKLNVIAGLNEDGSVTGVPPKATPDEPVEEVIESDVVIQDETPPPALVRINNIRLNDGQITVFDRTISPGFDLNVSEINTEIKDLATEADSEIAISTSATIDQSADLKFSGTIKPFASAKDLKIVATLNNYELIAVSPYTGKFIGYELDKGKLNFDIDYKIEQNTLIGQHDILIDKLNLGQSVKSEDAIKAPIKLALSLLQDRKQQINLNLPVKGDLNDPEFKYTHMIGKSLMNLFTKIVSSPFSLLADMAGLDGESFNYVGFEAGSDVLSETEKVKLMKMADVLNSRPKINLTIHPTIHEAVDLRALKSTALFMEEPDIQDGADDDRARKVLKKRYRKSFSSREYSDLEDEFENSGSPDWEVGFYNEARNRLIDLQEVDTSQLPMIADNRARNIQNFFIQEAQIDPSRIFIGKPEQDDEKDTNIVKNKLSLSAK